MRLWRRVRGVLATALVWGVTWSVLGVVLKIGRLLLTDSHPSLRMQLLEQAGAAWRYGFAYGAALGLGFALYVMLAGVRARSLRDISLRQFAVGGAAVAIATHWWVVGAPLIDAYVLVSASLSAGVSTASLLLARRADRLSLPASAPQLPAAQLTLP